MMDALNLLAKAAQETASSGKTAKGGKGVKGGETAQKGGFSHELKGLSGEQGGGKGSARAPDAKVAEKIETAADAASAEKAGMDKTGVGKIETEAVGTEERAADGPRAFASLKAELRTVLDAPRDAAIPKTVEAEPAGDGQEAQAAAREGARKKAAVAGEAAKVKSADFSGLGAKAETKTVADGRVAAAVAHKAETAAKVATDTLEPASETDAPETPEVETAPERGAGETLSDVLGLLVAGAAAEGIADRKPAGGTNGRGAETKSAPVPGVTNAGTEAVGADAPDEQRAAAAPDDGQQDRIFRLERGEGRGQSVDLKIASDASGRIDVEARAPATGQAETVNVVETRRYLGFNAPSNSSSLTAALAGNDEWVSAMHPSARLANQAQLSSTGQVVNTLKLELNPASLGTVTAMLRLSGDDLSVHLTVHTATAYRELRDDASGMLDALRSQGFSVDQVTVSMAPASSSQDGGDAASRFSQQQQQSAQQAAGDGGRDSHREARQNARQDAPDGGRPGTATGRMDESEQNLSVARGAGRARPDHVYI